MVLTARLKPRPPGIIAARHDAYTFLPRKSLVGHANRVQPYPQTATGYPKTRSCLPSEYVLFLPPPSLRAPWRPLSAKGERDRRPGSCDGRSS